MRKLFVIVIATVALLLGAPTASSYTDPECQNTITGTYNGDIHVPVLAYWCITDAVVNGNVYANGADQLDIYESTINGSVFVTNSSNSNIFESNVTGMIYGNGSLALNVYEVHTPLILSFNGSITSVKNSTIDFLLSLANTGYSTIWYNNLNGAGAWFFTMYDFSIYSNKYQGSLFCYDVKAYTRLNGNNVGSGYNNCHA